MPLFSFLQINPTFAAEFKIKTYIFDKVDLELILKNSKMKISLIIAFYKNIAALELIIKALQKQTFQNFEVIIAEDDCNPETLENISHIKIPQRIKHVFQDQDLGFRKNKILNEAIKIAEGDFIVFIDGDCIPHKNFLKIYSLKASERTVLFGRRILLSEKITHKLYAHKQLKDLTFWSLWTSKSKKIKYSFYFPFFQQIRKIGIVGSNWGLYKKHLLAINGFDEDYITAGVGEDNDIEWRLIEYGLKLNSIRFSAIQYHLHHKFNYSTVDTNQGYILLDKKMKQNNFYCKNGINKLQIEE